MALATSSYLWRHVIEQLERQRRCVAAYLPLHGQPLAAAGLLAASPSPVRRRLLRRARADQHRPSRQGHRRRDLPGVRRKPPRTAAHADQLRGTANFRPRRWRCSATSPGTANACTAPVTRTSPTCPPTSRTPGLRPLFGTAESARHNDRILPSLHARDLLAIEPLQPGHDVGHLGRCGRPGRRHTTGLGDAALGAGPRNGAAGIDCFHPPEGRSTYRSGGWVHSPGSCARTQTRKCWAFSPPVTHGVARPGR